MSVECARQGPILVISLQREEKRNAIDEEMALGIDGALNDLEDDDELWVGIITGTSTVFSAGTDLRVGSGPGTERGGPYGIIRRRRSKPLIAAVEGAALGGGMEIVLACDLVVASTTATFGLPEVRRGLLALYGGVFRSARSLPLNVAREIVLTGDPIDAALGRTSWLGQRRDRARGCSPRGLGPGRADLRQRAGGRPAESATDRRLWRQRRHGLAAQ